MDGNKKITGIIFAGIIVLAITACKVQPPGYVSLYVDTLISVSDTTDPGEAPLNMVDTAMAHVVDTTVAIEAELPVFLHPAEEMGKVQADPLTLQQLRAKDEQIRMLQDQLNAMQNAAVTTPQPITREPAQLQPLGNQRIDNLTLQQLRAKDEQIRMLQDQLNVMQSAAVKAPQPTHITREPAKLQPLGNQQTDPLTLQLLQARNDTIQLLRSQLYNLQLHTLKNDTVFIEKEAKELQPANELVADQKVYDLFKASQDTIRLLKTHVLSLEEQILAGKDTPVIAKQDEKDIPYKTKTDTVLLVAYYSLGKVKPLEEESILQQIKELCKNKNVTKIILSGYTDSSGSEIINKEITTLRLNYLLEKTIPWIAKEKVFFQNFGDTFASDMVVSDERRIEIRIQSKQDHEIYMLESEKPYE